MSDLSLTLDGWNRSHGHYNRNVDVGVANDDAKGEYYEYVLLYVDNSLAISHDAMATLDRMDKFSMMKKGSIGDPDIYFEEKLRKVQLDNGVFA